MVGAPTRFGSRDADEAALGDGRARRAQGDEPAPRSVAPTHLSSSTAQDPARDVATPDGRVYAAGASDAPLAAIGRVIARGGRIVGKGIMTVWRLAGALDAALWHGVKFAARAFAEVLLSSLRLLAAIAVDLIRWLPAAMGAPTAPPPALCWRSHRFGSSMKCGARRR